MKKLLAKEVDMQICVPAGDFDKTLFFCPFTTVTVTWASPLLGRWAYFLRTPGVRSAVIRTSPDFTLLTP